MSGSIRANQLVIEAFGQPDIASNIRANQLIIEAFVQPASYIRANQLIIEAFGVVRIFGELTFTGNVDGEFYATNDLVVQLIPVPFNVLSTNVNNTLVTISGGISGEHQTLIQDGGWYPGWDITDGPLTITFSNGNPVRSIWFYPTGETTADVWASSQSKRPSIEAPQ